MINQNKIRTKTIEQFKSADHKRSQLETHLQHVTTKFDKKLSLNSRLRHLIEDMRLQKATFLKIYQRLLYKIQQTKTAKKKVIQGILLTQEQREEILARIQTVKQQASLKLRQYNAEIDDMSRIYDHEEKLQTFITTKSFDRSCLEDRKQRHECIVKAKEKIIRIKNEIVRCYQATYKKLITLTGQEDLDTLAEQYIDKEIKNFGAFTYVSGLILEAETMEDEIASKKNLISTLQSQHVQTVRQQENTETWLKEQILRVEQEANVYEGQCNDKCRHLENQLSSVLHILNTITYEATPFKKKLAAEAFTYIHLSQYICVIEKRIDELLCIKAFLSGHELSFESLSPILENDDIEITKDPTKMMLPDVDDDTDEAEDSDVKVLSYEELKNMALVSINRKEQSSAVGAENTCKKKAAHLYIKEKSANKNGI